MTLCLETLLGPLRAAALSLVSLSSAAALAAGVPPLAGSAPASAASAPAPPAAGTPTPAPERAAVAAEHFARGYRLARAGDMQGAIAAFEAAYSTQPEFAVLYNLGLAYASAGRPVEAVDTLERYLALGAERVPSARREQVRALIRRHSEEIGAVLVDAPYGAAIAIDGEPRAEAPLTAPLRARVGRHVLTLQRGSEVLSSIPFALEPGNVLALHVPAGQLPIARVELECPVPDVEVAMDGRALGGDLPVTVPVLAGARAVSFTRAGYRAHVHPVELVPSRTERVTCALEVDATAPGLARLGVRHPAGTTLLVDGAPAAPGALPPGRHHLRVSGPGYEALERTIRLAPASALTVELLPSRSRAALEAERETRRRGLRLASYIAAGTGLVAGAAALGIYVSNDAAEERWQSQSDALVARLALDPASVQPGELDALIESENTIRHRDTAALGLSVLGAACLAAGGALFWWSRPDRPSFTLTGSAVAVRVPF